MLAKRRLRPDACSFNNHSTFNRLLWIYLHCCCIRLQLSFIDTCAPKSEKWDRKFRNHVSVSASHLHGSWFSSLVTRFWSLFWPLFRLGFCVGHENKQIASVASFIFHEGPLTKLHKTLAVIWNFFLQSFLRLSKLGLSLLRIITQFDERTYLIVLKRLTIPRFAFSRNIFSFGENGSWLQG